MARLSAWYLRRDGHGQIAETPDRLFARVAHVEPLIGSAEWAWFWEDRLYTTLTRGDFLPNSSALTNLGTPLSQLSARVVLPIDNTMESIFGTLRDAALVAQIYRDAHSLGRKGVTVYRYGSVAKQVLLHGRGEGPYEREHVPPCDPAECRL